MSQITRLPLISTPVVNQHPQTRAPNILPFQPRVLSDRLTLRFEGSLKTDEASLNTPKRMLDTSKVKIFTGTANPQLAKDAVSYLNAELGKVKIKQFTSKETYVKIEENVRGCDTFIIQPTCAPANDTLMELMFMIDALKRANAKTVTVMIPYFGYARQDRRAEPREALASKVVADMLCNVGATRVAVMDMHSPQLELAFDKPVDHLTALPLAAGYMRLKNIAPEDLVVVSPDVGGSKRASFVAKELGAGLAIVRKERKGHDGASALDLIGDVNGKTVLIFDDMIDSGGTLKEATRLLKEKGAKKIIAMATHGVLSGNAFQNLSEAPIDEVVVSDTIPLSEELKKLDKLTQITIAPIIGEAIFRMVNGESVSEIANIQCGKKSVGEHITSFGEAVVNFLKRLFGWLKFW